MDCDDESTFGPYVRLHSAESQWYNSGAMMHQGFTIDIPEAGEFEVEMHHLRLYRHREQTAHLLG